MSTDFRSYRFKLIQIPIDNIRTACYIKSYIIKKLMAMILFCEFSSILKTAGTCSHHSFKILFSSCWHVECHNPHPFQGTYIIPLVPAPL